MSRSNRNSLTILLATLGGALILLPVCVWVAPALIESGWRGDSMGFVNRAFEGRAEVPLEEYLEDWRRIWPGLLVNWVTLGGLVVLAARPEAWAVARRAFGSSAVEIYHATPKLAIGLVLLSLAVTEWYPFSQFPMYSTFSSEGGYVFVTDLDDEPLPSKPLGQIRPDEIQRILKTNLAEERERRPEGRDGWYLDGPHPRNEAVEAAAVRTLRYLRDERFGTGQPLRLWRTRLVVDDGTIHHERELLGEVPAR